MKFKIIKEDSNPLTIPKVGDFFTYQELFGSVYRCVADNFNLLSLQNLDPKDYFLAYNLGKNTICYFRIKEIFKGDITFLEQIDEATFKPIPPTKS